jgi:hypothetical protein
MAEGPAAAGGAGDPVDAVPVLAPDRPEAAIPYADVDVEDLAATRG